MKPDTIKNRFIEELCKGLDKNIQNNVLSNFLQTKIREKSNKVFSLIFRKEFHNECEPFVFPDDVEVKSYTFINYSGSHSENLYDFLKTRNQILHQEFGNDNLLQIDLTTIISGDCEFDSRYCFLVIKREGFFQKKWKSITIYYYGGVVYE